MVIITATLMFYNFLSALWQGSGTYQIFCFIFTLWSAGMAKSTNRQVHSFLLTTTWSGNLTGIGWPVCVSKFQWILCHFVKQILVYTSWLVLEHVNPCWVIFYQNHFNNYGLQLYTRQKCIFTNIFKRNTYLQMLLLNYINTLVYQIF